MSSENDEKTRLWDEKEVKIHFGSELPREIVITLRLISKKWAMPLLYALHNKNLGFSALKNRLGNGTISSNMLSRALEELQENNLLEKRVVSISPIRVEYSITVYGNDLCDLCLALGSFGSRYLMSKIDNNNNKID